MRPALIAAAFVSMFAVPGAAMAQPVPVRVAVQPGQGAPTWSGGRFEKHVECTYLASTGDAVTWPLRRGRLGSGNAVAPLFNPGAALPAGGYATSPDDGFNTLYVPMTGAAGAAIACRGTIRADGRDVTQRNGGDVSIRTLASISAQGPVTVTLAPDLAALRNAGGSRPPGAQAWPVLRSGTFSFGNPAQGAWTGPDMFFNLETGQSGTTNVGGGLKIAVSGSGSMVTGTEGSARILISQGMVIHSEPLEQPDYEKCATPPAPNTPVDYGVSLLYNGPAAPHFVCLKTASGHIARLHIVKVHHVMKDFPAPWGPRPVFVGVDLAYTVWSKSPTILQ